MLNSKVFTITAILLALVCVIISVTASPVPVENGLIKRKGDNQTELESDSIPVSSDGGDLDKYNPDDEVPKNITDNGNSAEGDGKGLRKRWSTPIEY